MKLVRDPFYIPESKYGGIYLIVADMSPCPQQIRFFLKEKMQNVPKRKNMYFGENVFEIYSLLREAAKINENILLAGPLRGGGG